MSNIKISSDLFLGTPELNRFQKFFLDGDKNSILSNSSSFGLIRNNQDPSLNNSKVSSDSDLSIGGSTSKTIKVNTIKGIDRFGNFISKDITNQIPVPGDDRWYWVRISYENSHEEKGTWSISSDGIISGVNGELTKILRGQPNFPSRVRFLNSTINNRDFDILSITNDNHAILNGTSFQNENNLKLAIVGTFTYGAPIQVANKLIFNYDSAKIELIREDLVLNNTKPTDGFESGRTFYIARVKSDGSVLSIQDKRTEFWESNATNSLKHIDPFSNPLIGVEAIKFDHQFSTQEDNIVELAWSFKSTSWSVNAERNIITISSGSGGKFKNVNDFVDGNFNGWRLYTENGKYSNIVTSQKQGNAIDLHLDVLDIDNYSTDGGISFLQNQTVIVAPNAENIQITFTPAVSDNISTQKQTFEFEINKDVGRCKVLAYKDITIGSNSNIGGNYTVTYRYKNNAEYSVSRIIPNDSVGYLTEKSFDINGNILPQPETVRKPYQLGEISLIISPRAYKNINQKLDKGDLIGVNEMTSLSNIQNIDLIVGESLNTLHIKGDISLSSDLSINLSTVNIVNGNEFNIHFDCNSINLNDHVINISSGSKVKTLSTGDFYMMKNIDGGITVNAKSNGTSWIFSQNYDLGKPNEVIMLDGNIASLFKSGWGRIKGLYGYAICDGSVDGSPDLSQRFIIGQDQSEFNYRAGSIGGEPEVTLNIDQMPNHDHTFDTNDQIGISDNANDRRVMIPGSTQLTSDSTGGGKPHNNIPPYYALIFAKKMF